MEGEVTKTYVHHLVHELIPLSHSQGNVGIQGQLGPPGPQGIGEPGPPVRITSHATEEIRRM